MDYFDAFADPAATARGARRHRHALPRGLVRQRLALRHGPLARDRPHPGRPPGAGDLPRDRLAARPRLVPAGDPGVPPHRGRVPGPRGRGRRADEGRPRRRGGHDPAGIAGARPGLRRRRPPRGADRRAGCRGQGVELVARRPPRVPHARHPRGAGRHRRGPAGLRGRVLRRRGALPDAPGHAPPGAGAARDDARRAGGGGLVPQLRALARAPAPGPAGEDAGQPGAARTPGTRRPTSTSARSATSRTWRARRACRWRRGASSTATAAPRPARSRRRPNLLAAGAVYLLTR